MKLLFLHISGLHLGYLGCYGNDWVATPTFDRLAAEGIVFDEHHADCFEQPSTIQTGRYHFSWLHDSSDSTATVSLLQEILKTNAIELIRIDNVLDAEMEVSETFQSSLQKFSELDSGMLWVDMPSLLPPWNVGVETLFHYFKDDVTEDDDAEPTVAPLLDPKIGAVDCNDADLMESLQLTYASVATQADDQLSVVVKTMEEHGVFDQATLIITSDAGYPLGEHGQLGHEKPWLHEEDVHLPLLIRLPSMAECGRRIAALTQPVDLFSTILEAFELTPPSNHGMSLWPLMKGVETKQREYICTGRKIGELEEWLLRTKDWALLVPGGEEFERAVQLFMKPEDRWEMNSVVQTHFDWAEQLEEVLKEWKRALAHNVDFKPPPLPKTDE